MVTLWMQRKGMSPEPALGPGGQFYRMWFPILRHGRLRQNISPIPRTDAAIVREHTSEAGNEPKLSSSGASKAHDQGN